MIERNIDCRKHRKSTHLASPDLDAMVLEKKPLLFTITDVKFETGVDVSGNKTDAYFVKFMEHTKEMVLNSVNRSTLSDIALNMGFSGTEKYNIGNWIGIQIELFVDRNVKMMGKIVDGIRIKPEAPKPISKERLLEVKKNIKELKSLKEVNSFYAKLLPIEKVNISIMKDLKDKQIDLKQQ